MTFYNNLKNNIKKFINYDNDVKEKNELENIIKIEHLPKLNAIIKECFLFPEVFNEIVKSYKNLNKIIRTHINFQSSHQINENDKVISKFTELNICISFSKVNNKIIINDTFEFESELDLSKMYNDYEKYVLVSNKVSYNSNKTEIFKQSLMSTLELTHEDKINRLNFLKKDDHIFLCFDLIIKLNDNKCKI